jgi:hypothetical protein
MSNDDSYSFNPDEFIRNFKPTPARGDVRAKEIADVLWDTAEWEEDCSVQVVNHDFVNGNGPDYECAICKSDAAPGGWLRVFRLTLPGEGVVSVRVCFPCSPMCTTGPLGA